MILAVFCLVTGEATVFADGFGVKPVAIGVHLSFDKIFVVGNIVLFAKFFGDSPGFSFDFDAFNMRVIIFVAREGVA